MNNHFFTENEKIIKKKSFFAFFPHEFNESLRNGDCMI